MSWLASFWTAVWPNLAASVLWLPVSLVHITRSNRKHMAKMRVEFGLPESDDVGDQGDHLSRQ